jgi:hypothetical protein
VCLSPPFAIAAVVRLHWAMRPTTPLGHNQEDRTHHHEIAD